MACSWWRWLPARATSSTALLSPAARFERLRDIRCPCVCCRKCSEAKKKKARHTAPCKEKSLCRRPFQRAPLLLPQSFFSLSPLRNAPHQFSSSPDPNATVLIIPQEKKSLPTAQTPKQGGGETPQKTAREQKGEKRQLLCHQFFSSCIQISTADTDKGFAEPRLGCLDAFSAPRSEEGHGGP